MKNSATIRAAAVNQAEDALCVAVAIALGAASCELDGIMVASDAGQIVLSGRLNSYHMKQMAQTIAKSVRGVELLQNCIRVEAHGSAS